MNIKEKITQIDSQIQSMERALGETIANKVPLLSTDPDSDRPDFLWKKAGKTILFDEEFTAPAFYWLERWGREKKSFRWFGKEDLARIKVRFPSCKTLRIDVEIPLHAAPEALDGFSFGCGEQMASQYETETLDDGSLVRTAIFRDVLDEDGIVELVLVSGWKKDMSYKGDSRTISVGIHKIVLTQID